MRKSPLEEIRSKIDKIDDRIVALLKLRFKFVLKTLKYKTKTIDRTREEQILKRVSKKYSSALPVFLSIMKESKRLQRRAKTK
jgi:chorismate mutase